MLKIIAISLLVLMLTSISTSTSYAKFIKEDFEITDFGLKEGNPYLNVVGKAGQSFPVECEDECYYAYIFDTNKGKYAILIQSNLENNPKPAYGVSKFEAKSIKQGEEFNLPTTSAKHKFSQHTAELVAKGLGITKVSHVYALYLDAGDPTTIGKIWSSK